MKLTKEQLTKLIESVIEEQTSSDDKFFKHPQVEEVLAEIKLDLDNLQDGLETLYTLIDSRAFGRNFVPMRNENVRKLAKLSDRFIHTINEWNKVSR